MNPCQLVKSTCQRVVGLSTLVSINHEAIHRVAQSFPLEALTEVWDRSLHFFDEKDEEATALYLLVVDSLNFCFWGDHVREGSTATGVEGGLEYEHLSKGVRAVLLKDRTAFTAENLSKVAGPDVRALYGWHRELPLEEERARLLREVGSNLLRYYEGSAAKLVRAAGGSAVRLVELVTQAFPGFRDHAVYKGGQVFFYKRAQIFAGDVWGAYRGQGLGAFDDVHELTMFADYRVPVTLRNLGILSYAPELDRKIASGVELPAGGEEELEIRAATVIAVEQLRDAVVAAHFLHQGPPSIVLDWWLWGEGEKTRTQDLHHRCTTIYY